MSITYGIGPTGFVAKTAQILTAQVASNMTSSFGASFVTTPNSAAGQLAGIIGAIGGELWELAEQCVNGLDRDTATGTQLDADNALVGCVRLPATYTMVFLTLTGTPGTDALAGFKAETTSNNGAVLFTTLTDATLAVTPAWAGAQAYVVGNRVTNASRVYYCIAAGTSAGSGGPTTTALSIPDGSGSLLWMYLGDGTGNADALSQAQATGALVAASADVTTIVTPISGVNNVTNVFNATTGSAVETDEQYRVRCENNLAGAGDDTAGAIEADLLDVAGVTAATVYNNTSDVTDGNGVPAHSILALVQGGADQDVVNLLGAQVPAGIGTAGSSSGTYTDQNGFTSTINFQRPVPVPIWVTVTLKYDNTNGGANYVGDTAVQDAISTYAIASGYNVFATRIAAIVLALGGVLDVPRSGSLGGVLISTSVTPTSDATITITPFEIATFTTADVVVNSSGEAP